MQETLILGIDGGGTKTLALLAAVSSAGTPKILGRCAAGSTNVNAVGWEEAFSNLRIASQGAWEAANREATTAEMAVLALSGAGRDSAQKKIADWVTKEGIASRVEVIHDAEAVLMAGTPEGYGVALIAGTGAVALAVNESQESSISGGWGYWFGDEGSAFWLGQAALRAVSLAADGRGPATSLEAQLLEHLQIDKPRDLLSALSTDNSVRQAIASLARSVVGAAETGDHVAKAIVDEGALHLAKLVHSSAAAVTLGPDFSLAVAGGVLCGSPYVQDALRLKLGGLGLEPHPVESVAEPALGTLNLACRKL